MTDATREKDVVALFDEADTERDVELVVYNVGNNVAAPALDTTSELFERLWRQNALGGFLVGREAARRLAPRQKGTILFTGATASLTRATAFHRLRAPPRRRCAPWRKGSRANLRLKASMSLISS